MTLVDEVTEKIRQLPADKQREVLDFVEFLQHRGQALPPRQDPEGILKDFAFDLSLEEFQELRREMTRNFPREFPGA